MLEFRLPDAEFASQVDQFAPAPGVSRSDYVRQAVDEKNAGALAERIAFLPKTLSASHQHLTSSWMLP
jgi:hypothetical protein